MNPRTCGEQTSGEGCSTNVPGLNQSPGTFRFGHRPASDPHLSPDNLARSQASSNSASLLLSLQQYFSRDLSEIEDTNRDGSAIGFLRRMQAGKAEPISAAVPASKKPVNWRQVELRRPTVFDPLPRALFACRPPPQSGRGGDNLVQDARYLNDWPFIEVKGPDPVQPTCPASLAPHTRWSHVPVRVLRH